MNNLEKREYLAVTILNGFLSREKEESDKKSRSIQYYIESSVKIADDLIKELYK